MVSKKIIPLIITGGAIAYFLFVQNDKREEFLFKNKYSAASTVIGNVTEGNMAYKNAHKKQTANVSQLNLDSYFKKNKVYERLSSNYNTNFHIEVVDDYSFRFIDSSENGIECVFYYSPLWKNEIAGYCIANGKYLTSL